jgi:ankyrin repeat protein
MSGPAPSHPQNVLRDLQAAVCADDLAKVKTYATRDNVNYVDPEYGLSLLMWAIAGNRIDVARHLLTLGASTKLRDRKGFAVLHRAVWESEVEAVRLLVHEGHADVDIRSVKHNKTPLILAAMKGEKEKLLVLLRHGANIDSRGADGLSAVDHATYKGFADVVEVLIESGADCHAARFYSEEGAKYVETLKQRQNFNRIIELMCRPWASQSLVSV